MPPPPPVMGSARQGALPTCHALQGSPDRPLALSRQCGASRRQPAIRGLIVPHHTRRLSYLFAPPPLQRKPHLSSPLALSVILLTAACALWVKDPRSLVAARVYHGA